MKKQLIIALIITLIGINSIVEGKTVTLPLEGFFYTTGKTIRFYDLKKDASKQIYASQDAQIDGLYYDAKPEELYFTELRYQKGNSGTINNATYTVRKLNLHNGKSAPVIYRETRSGDNLNYYLFAQYHYNNYLLFDIEGGETSYYRIFDTNLKKFIFTTGEGLHSSYFEQRAKVFIHNYNDDGSINEYLRITLKAPIEIARLTQKEYEKIAKNALGLNPTKIEALPGLTDYPKDCWGNIFRRCIREKNLLALSTFFAKTPLTIGGEQSYLGNTITFYDLNTETVIKNITIKDFVPSEDVIQPFCLKVGKSIE